MASALSEKSTSLPDLNFLDDRVGVDTSGGESTPVSRMASSMLSVQTVPPEASEKILCFLFRLDLGGVGISRLAIVAGVSGTARPDSKRLRFRSVEDSISSTVGNEERVLCIGHFDTEMIKKEKKYVKRLFRISEEEERESTTHSKIVVTLSTFMHSPVPARPARMKERGDRPIRAAFSNVDGDQENSITSRN